MNKEELEKIIADARGKGEIANLKDADLRNANLVGVDMQGADLRGANLRCANLRDSDLWCANLENASLLGANLHGAELGYANLENICLFGVVGNRKEIKSLFISKEYPIAYTSQYLQIGCERHLIDDWWYFTDKKIMIMDGKRALVFWRKYKDYIKQTITLAPAVHLGVQDPIL